MVPIFHNNCKTNKAATRPINPAIIAKDKHNTARFSGLYGTFLSL